MITAVKGQYVRGYTVVCFSQGQVEERNCRSVDNYIVVNNLIEPLQGTWTLIEFGFSTSEFGGGWVDSSFRLGIHPLMLTKLAGVRLDARHWTALLRLFYSRSC
ncbi:unnamed protein product [Dicrocoelium dendriticum]|nr:unnamed protein product [Dicrocoelium dendriticum]